MPRAVENDDIAAEDAAAAANAGPSESQRGESAGMGLEGEWKVEEGVRMRRPCGVESFGSSLQGPPGQENIEILVRKRD